MNGNGKMWLIAAGAIVLVAGGLVVAMGTGEDPGPDVEAASGSTVAGGSASRDKEGAAKRPQTRGERRSQGERRSPGAVDENAPGTNAAADEEAGADKDTPPPPPKAPQDPAKQRMLERPDAPLPSDWVGEHVTAYRKKHGDGPLPAEMTLQELFPVAIATKLGIPGAARVIAIDNQPPGAVEALSTAFEPRGRTAWKVPLRLKLPDGQLLETHLPMTAAQGNGADERLPGKPPPKPPETVN